MFYPIQLDKARNFRYGMKAIDRLEKKLKKPIAKMDIGSATMEETAILIWAGLAHEDSDLNPDKVMDLVDEYSDLPTIMEVAAEALQAAFGTPVEQTEEDKEKNG